MKLKTSHSLVPSTVVEACRDLGERLKVARQRRKLTQVQLARRAGLTAFTIARIEKGFVSTELASIVRVLWAMGLEGTLLGVADMAHDEVGQAMGRAQLPRRVRHGALDDDF
jgi:predicted transcriptional regulator